MNFIFSGYLCSPHFALIWRWKAQWGTGLKCWTKHLCQVFFYHIIALYINYIAKVKIRIQWFFVNRGTGGSCSFDGNTGLPDSNCQFTVTGPENLESSAMALPQVFLSSRTRAPPCLKHYTLYNVHAWDLHIFWLLTNISRDCFYQKTTCAFLSCFDTSRKITW